MSALTPKYPNAIATDAWLTIATNQLQTILAIPCAAADTTLGVTDASRIVQWSLLTLVDANSTGVSEIVLVVLPPSGNIITVQRGYDGTTAVAHASGCVVNGYIVAWHQKSLAAEIEAIEQALGPNLANIGTGVGGVFVAAPFTPQIPGGTLSPGNNVITLAPVPPGVNGTDTDHWLYIDLGTGTPEPVKITGGTAVAGAGTGTVIVNCAFAHSGPWRIGTATAGISEAVWKMGAAGGKVTLSGGTLAIHAPIRRRTGMPIWIEGQGMEATILAVAADFPNGVAGVNGVLDWTPGDGTALCEGGAHDLSIHFIQPDSTNVATYTHWKPAVWTSGTYHTEWRNIMLVAAWDGFIVPTNTNGAQFYNLYGSFFGTFIRVDQSFDTVRIHDLHTATTGLTNNQITAFMASGTGNVSFDMQRVDNLIMTSCTAGTALAARFESGADGLGPSGFVSDFWSEGQIVISNGDLRFQSLIIAGSGSSPTIIHSGGRVFFDELTLLYTGTSNAIFSSVTHNASSAGGTYPPEFRMVNSRIDTQNQDVIALSGACAAPYAGEMNYILAGNLFYRGTGSYTNATININNGTGDVRLTLTGNRFTAIGSGTTLVLGNDNYHVVIGNDGGGGSLAFLSTQAKMLIGLNNNFFAATYFNLVNSPLKAVGKVTAGTPVNLIGENFIASETGAANAIAGALVDAAGVAVPYTAGLKFTILLAHPLGAGANTVNLNGLGAKNIKSSRNPANNIATAYSAGGLFTGLYDGTQVLDVTQ